MFMNIRYFWCLPQADFFRMHNISSTVCAHRIEWMQANQAESFQARHMWGGYKKFYNRVEMWRSTKNGRKCLADNSAHSERQSTDIYWECSKWTCVYIYAHHVERVIEIIKQTPIKSINCFKDDKGTALVYRNRYSSKLALPVHKWFPLIRKIYQPHVYNIVEFVLSKDRRHFFVC